VPLAVSGPTTTAAPTTTLATPTSTEPHHRADHHPGPRSLNPFAPVSHRRVPALADGGAISVDQPAAESGQDHPDRPPAFRMGWRGYDRDEVDAYLPTLTARLGEAVDRSAEAEQARAELQREVIRLSARLREAVDRSAQAEQARAELQREVASLREESLQQLGGEATALLQEAGRSAEQLVEHARRHAETILEKAQQQAEQLRADGTNEAQQALKQAREVADQLHREVEQQRAALHRETEQVHAFRDGLVGDLGRVHGAISALLERLGTQRDQPLTAGGAADPQAATAPTATAEKPPEPRKVPERAKVAEPG
jgi:DivIVA domain-containing protein